MEGVVMADVSTYKGHPISSNLPIKVKFTEPVKVIAHLVSDTPPHTNSNTPFAKKTFTLLTYDGAHVQDCEAFSSCEVEVINISFG
jgi:hypothetical protein